MWRSLRLNCFTWPPSREQISMSIRCSCHNKKERNELSLVLSVQHWQRQIYQWAIVAGFGWGSLGSYHFKSKVWRRGSHCMAVPGKAVQWPHQRAFMGHKLTISLGLSSPWSTGFVRYFERRIFPRTKEHVPSHRKGHRGQEEVPLHAVPSLPVVDTTSLNFFILKETPADILTWMAGMLRYGNFSFFCFLEHNISSLIN